MSPAPAKPVVKRRERPRERKSTVRREEAIFLVYGETASFGALEGLMTAVQKLFYRCVCLLLLACRV